MVKNFSFNLETRGFNDIIDISGEVFGLIRRSGMSNAHALVFSAGSTCGITTIEFESGAVADLAACMERIAPQDIGYRHNLRWGDGNGFSHVRAALMNASFSFPVIDGEPHLGTWQQIVLLDFDNKPRTRKVIVQLGGE
ncbi:MAG: secondary thiamine-phosphate synthase enzyme YjbQ [Bacteroidota bacterium]